MHFHHSRCANLLNRDKLGAQLQNKNEGESKLVVYTKFKYSFFPISVKYPDPVYECVSENVLETWQKNNHTFKKTEYTMKLEVAGKCYFGSANTKKAAKTAVSTEAWNIVRSGNM